MIVVVHSVFGGPERYNACAAHPSSDVSVKRRRDHVGLTLSYEEKMCI